MSEGSVDHAAAIAEPIPAHDRPTVCVLGLGYVGLTLAAVMADVGYKVIGVDRNEALVEDVKAGKPHFHEKGLEELLVALARRPEPPRYLAELAEPCAQAYIISVGTPILKPAMVPNLDYVRRAATEIGRVLCRGDLVVLRSTVPVGTTRKVVLPVLEQLSGLKAGPDFSLAFCPERTVEGKALRELRELPQIVGGVDPHSAETAAHLFRRNTPAIIDVGSLEEAEMIKIMDNTYRDVMFAYANQIALLCEAIGLDMVPLVRAANSGYNRNNIPVPSPGVGGACLSKDPYILASVCREAGVDPLLFELGRRINEHMPVHTCRRTAAELQRVGKSLKGAEVLVLGFAFKGRPETSDLRDSPTLDLLRELAAAGAHVRGYDPVVTPDEIAQLGARPCGLKEGFDGVDAAIIMLNHQAFEDMDLASLLEAARKPVVVIDGWHLHNADDLAQMPGVVYRCIGQ